MLGAGSPAAALSKRGGGCPPSLAPAAPRQRPASFAYACFFPFCLIPLPFIPPCLMLCTATHSFAASIGQVLLHAAAKSGARLRRPAAAMCPGG